MNKIKKENSVVDEPNQALLIPTTRTLVKEAAGTADSGIRKSCFPEPIKGLQPRIDRLPPTEVVNCSVH